MIIGKYTNNLINMDNYFMNDVYFYFLFSHYNSFNIIVKFKK